MKSKTLSGRTSLLLAGFLFISLRGHAIGPFAEDFEKGLGQWTGRAGGAHSGTIVPDPLASGRGQVLSFSQLASGGDSFLSNPITLTGPITVSFDYLGMPGLGGNPGDLGGFFGAAYSLTATTLGTDLFWYGGTQDSYPGLLLNLVDDGTWHHYSFQLNASTMPPFHLVLEDFVGSGGVPRDVFFDNIIVEPVPEPTVASLTFLAAVLLTVARRRG